MTEPVHVSYYQCPYCGQTRGKRNRVWEHMEECFHNPDVTSCPPHDWAYDPWEYGGKDCRICGLTEHSGGQR